MPLSEIRPGQVTLLTKGIETARLSLLCRKIDTRLRADSTHYALALCAANPAAIASMSRKIRKLSGQKRAARYPVRDAFQALEALQQVSKPLAPRLRMQLADVLSSVNPRGFSASCKGRSVDDLLLTDPTSKFARMYLALLHSLNVRHPYTNIDTTVFPDSVTDVFIHDLDSLNPALIRWWVERTHQHIDVWASCANPDVITRQLGVNTKVQIEGSPSKRSPTQLIAEHRAFPSTEEQCRAILANDEVDTVFLLSGASRIDLEWRYILSGRPYRIDPAVSVLSTPEVAILRSFLGWLTTHSEAGLRHIMEEVGVSPGAWVRFAKSQGLPSDPTVASMSTKPVTNSGSPILDRFSLVAQLVRDTVLQSHRNAIDYLKRWVQRNIPHSSVTPLSSLLDQLSTTRPDTEWTAQHLERLIAAATVSQNSAGPQLCATYQYATEQATRAWMSLGDSTCTENADLLTAVQGKVTKQLIISQAE